MSDTLVNIGVIGVGAFMARQHLPNMLANPRIRIYALCDTNAELLKERAGEFSPKYCTADAEAVFRDPAIQAVLVGTRSEMHAPFIELAARYRKHVFVEKPMTRTYGETASVLAAVRGTGINVGIGFNRRYAPIMVEAKRLFDDFRSGPANITYRIVDDHLIRPAYIFDMADGGGHLLQEGCHIFDLLAWFLGEEPVEVYAAGPIETDNAVILKFSGGSLATVLCGGKGGLFYPKELMEVFCNRTTLAMDQFYELRLDGPGRNFQRTFALDPKTGLTPAAGGMTSFYDTCFSQRPSHDVTDIVEGNRIYNLKVDKGHTQAIAEFAACIVDGRRYGVGVVDGARATVCALKAYESIRENRPVPICPEEYGYEGSGRRKN